MADGGRHYPSRTSSKCGISNSTFTELITSLQCSYCIYSALRPFIGHVRVTFYESLSFLNYEIPDCGGCWCLPNLLHIRVRALKKYLPN